MAKPGPRNGSPIEKLLHERNQFVGWLARLDESSGSVPDTVRHRVRADYQSRLDAVMEQLRAHEASVREQLERHRANQAEFQHRQAEAQEKMAEAELRHAVGEYDESSWQRIRGETHRTLLMVRDELTKVGDEINRLMEVESLIGGPQPPGEPEVEETIPTQPLDAWPSPENIAQAAAASHATAPSEPVQKAAPVGSVSRPLAPPRPARPVQPTASTAPSAPSAAEPAAKTLWFPSGKPGDQGPAKLDELAFLRSVTESEAPAPPRRVSGGTPRPAESAVSPTSAPSTPAAPASKPAEPPHPPPASVMETAATPPAAISPMPAAVPDPVSATYAEVTAERAETDVVRERSAPLSKERASQSSAKTLKCGECGTLNRPTEWYCEQCGAELAAL